jgi:hypothetical protein
MPRAIVLAIGGAAVAAGVGVLLWRCTKKEDAGPRTDIGPAQPIRKPNAVDAAVIPVVPDRVGEGPRLPDRPPDDRDVGDPNVVAIDPKSFDDEPRDVAWARDHEAEIAKRLAKLPDGVVLDANQCKSRQCRIAIRAADDAALMGAVGSIEGVDRLRGWANQIVLGAPVDAAGGKRAMTIYVQFE